jgi:hypothetical protein
MTGIAVPNEIVGKLRVLCLDLPDVQEEQAWVGTRWCIRRKNFAHVLMIDAGWPPAYAQAAGQPGPVCVLTFRLPSYKVGLPKFSKQPYFRPNWWPNIAGLVIGGGVNWDEVEVHIAESYCVLAPKKLAAMVVVPGR